VQSRTQIPWGIIGVAGVILALVVGAVIFLQRDSILPATSDVPPTFEVVINDPNAQTGIIGDNGTPAGIVEQPPTATSAPTNTPIPAPTEIPPIEYTVKAGDVCGNIAKQFNISIEEFTAFNNLDSVNCLIRVGDIVKIPAPTPTPGPTPTLAPGVTPQDTPLPDPTATLPPQVTYVVKGGDTCGEIAQKFNITIELLIVQNNLDANCLIGLNQVLTITFATPTPVATVTPFVLQTPTPRAGYAAPLVLAPADSVSISETQDVVTLQWLTVGLLKPNEWYVVQVQPSGAITVPIFETKATSLKLTQAILGGQLEGEIVWWVQVKQLLATDPNTGTRIYNDASPISEVRRFAWRRPAFTPTPPSVQ
jgi:LysM repeat protein